MFLDKTCDSNRESIHSGGINELSQKTGEMQKNKLGMISFSFGKSRSMLRKAGSAPAGMNS